VDPATTRHLTLEFTPQFITKHRFSTPCRHPHHEPALIPTLINLRLTHPSHTFHTEATKIRLAKVNMFSLQLFFIMALISLATTTPIAARAPDLDNLDPATFKINHNGQDYILKGTIQKVVAQMDVLHPGFDANLTAKINKDRSLSNRANLDKRDMELPPYCIPVPGWSWGNAASYWILEDGVPYLNGLQYELLAQPGPGWCTQISCNWNSGIYWCNDVSSTIKAS
jgi:hypothetical protein